MNGDQLPAGYQRGGVVDAGARIFRESHDRRGVGEPPPKARKTCLDLAAKAAVKQEVLRRIARERQLGEEHEIRTQLTLRAARGADDPLSVPLDVPDQEVHLRQRDPERLAHWVPAQNLLAIVSCLSAACPAPGVVPCPAPGVVPFPAPGVVAYAPPPPAPARV